MSKFTVGSLFAGVGGICLGFKQAGFDIKWANEFDKHACITYRLNNPKVNLVEGDIQKIEPKDLGYVDVITSGFPCQTFSIAGNREGFKDPRGNMFFETAKFIYDLKPKAYLLENVKNLQTHDSGTTLNKIKNVLVNDLGYSFITFVLNSCEHGNVPQNRERIFIVGFKDEAGIIPTNNQPNIFDNLDSKTAKFMIPKKINLTTKIEDLIFKDKQDDKYYFAEDHKYMPKLKEVMDSSDCIYQWRRVYVRKNMHNVCPTLTANMGSGGHNVPLVNDGFGFRKLTPRECFRFQGFPDSFMLPIELANSSLYKQAGNSVTVPVINNIAKNIMDVL